MLLDDVLQDCEVQKAKSEQTILTGSNVVQLGEKGKF